MDANRRIDDLEWRLARYHEELAATIEQRDRFGLEATWGILKGAIGSFALFGAVWATDHWLPEAGWLVKSGLTIAAIAVSILIAGLVISHFDKLEEDDARKMWRVPQWKEPDRSRDT